MMRAHLLLLFFIGTNFVSRTSAQDVPNVFSYPRGVPKSMHNFSWDVNETLNNCNGVRILLPVLSNIQDYGSVISLTLELLEAMGGGAAILSSGVYQVRSPIQIRSKTCILGAGATSTIIKVRHDSPPFYPKKGVIRATKTNHFVIRGVSINGNKNKLKAETKKDVFGRFGIHLSACKYAWIKDVHIFNNIGAGINVHGSSNATSSHVVLQNVVSNQNGADGVSLSNTRIVSIVNGSIASNGRHGVSLGASKKILMRKVNLFENGRKAKGCGVSISAGTYTVHLEDAFIGESPRAGVCVKDSKDISVFRSVVNNTIDEKAYCFHLTNIESFSDELTECNDISGQKFNKDSGMSEAVLNATRTA